MSADYTPTTEQVRDYVSIGGEPQPWNPPSRALDDARAAAFDRWLAAHDAEVTEALLTRVEALAEEWEEQSARSRASRRRVGKSAGLLSGQHAAKLRAALSDEAGAR